MSEKPDCWVLVGDPVKVFKKSSWTSVRGLVEPQRLELITKEYADNLERQLVIEKADYVSLKHSHEELKKENERIHKALDKASVWLLQLGVEKSLEALNEIMKVRPTHWMPLPAAPNADNDEVKATSTNEWPEDRHGDE